MKIGISVLNLKSDGTTNRTGLEWHAVQIVPALIAAAEGRHEFEIYLEESAPVPLEWLAAGLGSRVHHLPGVGRRLSRVKRYLTLDRTLRKRGLDRHFCLYSPPPFRPRIPTIYMVHDIFPITHNELCHPVAAKREPFFLRKGARYADRIITISEYSKQEIHENLGVPLNRIFVVLNSLGNPLTARTTKLNRAGNLLTVSTVEPRKNLARLIECVDQLTQDPAFQDLKLKVVGAAGWGAQEDLQRSMNPRVTPHVEFLGYVPTEEMQSLYEGASTFVFPSLMEGFGMPVLEAMMVGVPIACSDATSIPEVAGDLAYYFNPESVEEMSRAISASLADDSDRERRVEAGLARATQFTWESAGRAMLEICEA